MIISVLLLSVCAVDALRPALEAWASDECRTMYDFDEHRVHGPHPFLAAEDLRPGGRTRSMSYHQLGQEVIVSDKYKFVYVLNRKSASEAIRMVLWENFGITWCWCNEQCASVPACYEYGDRCSTMALNGTHMSEYTFFTFVRNPLERWFSSYAQAHVDRDTQDLSHVNISDAHSSVSALLEHSWLANPHLQTQTYALTAPTGEGYLVPMHFIGRVETIDADWEKVCRMITDDPELCGPVPLMHHAENRRPEYVAEVNKWRDDTALREKIKEAYAQDYACFGYDK